MSNQSVGNSTPLAISPINTHKIITAVEEKLDGVSDSILSNPAISSYNDIDSTYYDNT